MEVTSTTKATRLNLLDFKTAPMRAFHVTWITFFLCFFGWFGIAPLMPIIREDLGLTKSQIDNYRFCFDHHFCTASLRMALR
jgi:MFS transporter, NNP family, nitrate/nitrite transporter